MMLKTSDGRLLVIYGPTATGKTSLATRLAKKFSGEIISADSRQVYKGLDIGTGKVNLNSKVEKHKGYWIVDGVKIHGFDLTSPPVFEPGSKEYYEPGSEQGSFTVADFLRFTFASMIQIMKAKKLPIIVGGTGFYIKALLDGLPAIGIPPDQKLRQKLEQLSVQELYQKLLSINPDRAESMNQSDRANPRRLIRAIEIAMAGNYYVRHSGVATTTIESRSYRLRSRMTNTLVLGLTATNDYLYTRADKWLQTRLEKGLIQEVNRLIRDGVNPTWLENLGLEYRWLTRLILGRLSQEEALERLKGDIHNLIRRQKTWFKKFPSIRIYDISKSSWPHELEKTVKDWYNGTQ